MGKKNEDRKNEAVTRLKLVCITVTVAVVAFYI